MIEIKEQSKTYPAAHDVPNNIPRGIRFNPKWVNMGAPKHNQRWRCALNSACYVMETEKQWNVM
jgi:hypothetical protein